MLKKKKQQQWFKATNIFVSQEFRSSLIIWVIWPKISHEEVTNSAGFLETVGVPKIWNFLL